MSAVAGLQTDCNVHPLTCGNDSSHQPLIPIWDNELLRVTLYCADCDYTQSHLPSVVRLWTPQVGLHARTRGDETVRDPARIDRMLAQLRALWYAYPDLRLGQLVHNLGANVEPNLLDTYYVEDGEMERRIQAATAKGWRPGKW